MEPTFSRAERRAVELHQRHLCQVRCCEVTWQEAVDDWTAHHAVAWREARQARMLAEQRAEIERHKWIESEKAGRDVGRDAVLDWIRNNAAAWRHWYEMQEENAL